MVKDYKNNPIAQKIKAWYKKKKETELAKQKEGEIENKELSTNPEPTPEKVLNEIKEELKEKVHCEECNKPIPQHLLRGMFYKIIVDSQAIFKLLITGKNVGKTTNLILFQAWYLMNHKFGKFVWVFRTRDDKLKKGKRMWEEVLQEKLPLKNLEEFNEKDWIDNRGEEATGNGVHYKKKLRIRFCSLQDFQETDSSFGRNAIHLIFDEAMPSNGKELSGPNEAVRWSQVLNNVRNTEGKPTECYFLCNPHLKGAWFLRFFCHAEWLEESFNSNNENKEHFFEGEKEVWNEKSKSYKKAKVLLYQAPELEDDNSFVLDMIENNPYRHKEGLFEKKEEMFIEERPKMFYDGKEIDPFIPNMVIKDCVYACLKRSNNQKFFFYRKNKNEILPDDIIHFCSSWQEYHESPYHNKILIEGEKLKVWVRGFFYAMEAGQLSFCNSRDDFPDAYEAKANILPFIYQFDKEKLKQYIN